MRDRPAIAITPEARKRAIASIRRYFAEHLEQEIGELKAALVLDYFLAEHGPTIYNQAIADARAFLTNDPQIWKHCATTPSFLSGHRRAARPVLQPPVG
jgi:uncharacterized protein (DUF2164 family)